METNPNGKSGQSNAWEKQLGFDKVGASFVDANSTLLFENPISNEILTLPEVAARLKVSVSGLRKILRRRGIPGAFKVGQQWRFYWSKVARHLLSQGENYGVS